MSLFAKTHQFLLEIYSYFTLLWLAGHSLIIIAHTGALTLENLDIHYFFDLPLSRDEFNRSAPSADMDGNSNEERVFSNGESRKRG